jgi:hypothetical protein
MKFDKKTTSGPCIFVFALLIYPIAFAGAVDYDFTVEVRDPIKIASLQEFTTLKAYITNTGDLGDTLDVTLEFDVPDSNWAVLFCLGNVCYPPGVTQAPLSIGSGQVDSAYVDITPMNTEGGATASLTFQSRGDPGHVETVYVALITDSTDVLIVDGDGGSTYENFYRDAVPAAYTRGVWSTDLEPVTLNEIALFDYCVWLTGERVPALTTEEMGVLTGLLDSGGKLFISGQDIGRDIGGTVFYSDYLHASFVSDSTGILVLDGIDGEPISDGLTLQISGGDGANNQVRPSEVDVVRNGAFAHPTFYYESTEQVAAVSSVWFPSAPDSTHSSRVTYFAFGFEGIHSQADRNTVMQRVIEWLESSSVAIGEGDNKAGIGPEIPSAMVLHQNYPNPFNPSTSITFRLTAPARVDLSIYDLRGRRVISIVDKVLPAGEHRFVWDGKDENREKVGSGSYFYRLLANEETITRRMVVVK